MNFYHDVISHLLKNAFEGHTKFSVADSTAVGDNPVRSISLDAVPSNENTIISLSWEGGEKLFEKTLSEQESSHQFDLISTDLAEVAALTKGGQYDSAKDLMKKLGQKYAENTGDIVDTNLPKLHNTQAAIGEPEDFKSQGFDNTDPDTNQWVKQVSDTVFNVYEQGHMMDIDLAEYTPQEIEDVVSAYYRGGVAEIQETYGKEANKIIAEILAESSDAHYASLDGKLWRKAKITMQNLWFSTTDELLEYQEKQKGAKSTQDHIPLWDAQKGKGPAKSDDTLAPASLSYEDVENEKERDHEDMQKHIDEKIKTELESALQEKAASVFGPADIELVKSLRAPGIGRNWDEIKKIFIKDLNRDKDATTIFLDEQRESLDPTGIEVEPVKEEPAGKPGEEKAPLTPPEELVSPETHEKLLQDHEDKKKAPLTEDKELNFTPKDVMDIPEDEEIEQQSSLNNEIARADNDEIHKVAAPSDLNPLQEPLTEQVTTPNQDTVPMNKKPLDHDAPQHGDRVFVTTDMNNEKSGFEANFINAFKGNRGEDLALVETDKGDQLEVEQNRVVKINEGASGAQDTEPVMEPIIEQQQPESDIPTTPKMDDFHTSSQEDLLAIKIEAEALLKDIDGMEKISYKFIKKGLEKHADDSAFEGNGWCRVWIQEDEIASDSRYPEILKLPDENSRIEALKDLARELAHEALRLADSAGAKVGVQSWFDSLKPSDHDRIDWVKLANPTTDEEREWQEEQKGRFSSQDIKIEKQAKLYVGVSSQKPNWEVFESPVPPTQDKFPYNAVIGPFKTKEGAEFMAMYGKNNPQLQTVDDAERAAHQPKKASDFEKGISQNKTSADPLEAPKTQFKDYKITPKYTPKEQAIPATPEMDEVLTKMDSLQSNLATLEAARKQIQAKMKEELTKIDEQGERAQLEAALQESIEKAAVLISAMDNKVIQWKDRLYTLQTEEISYVPSLTPKEMLSKIYAKFSGAEKYVQDVLNGMLSQGKNVLEKTLIRWPNKKSSVNKEATIIDDINHYNEELLAALKELSSPL